MTATGRGLNPDKDAIYLNVTPGKNDRRTIYKLNVKDVPVDAFWFDQPLQRRRLFCEEPVRCLHALNNITPKKDADGSATSSSAAVGEDS